MRQLLPRTVVMLLTAQDCTCHSKRAMLNAQSRACRWSDDAIRGQPFFLLKPSHGCFRQVAVDSINVDGNSGLDKRSLNPLDVPTHHERSLQ